jgi:hypothetical protein
MSDLMKKIRNLKRSKLLCDAAKAGAPMYRRDRILRRLVVLEGGEDTAEILELLLNLEQDFNAQRETGAAHYRAARHVECLIAIRAEAATLCCPALVENSLQNQVNASGIEAFFSATNARSASAMAGSMAGC